jgi:hypothetical protein
VTIPSGLGRWAWTKHRTSRRWSLTRATLPEYFGSVRQPRTLGGWIEGILREEANLQDNAPTLWRWLKVKLKSLGKLTKIDEPRETDPRGDAYIIAIEGHEERLSYIQFQKLLTRSRKSPQTLADLIGTLG